MNDEEIIERYRASNEKLVLSELYIRYSHLILGLCRKYLKDRESAKDASCDIFISLFDKLLEHEVRHFRSWLFTLARNHCLMILRKEGRSPIVSLNGLEYNLEYISTLDSVLQDEQRIQLLEEAIDSLGPEQARCIRLFYFKKYSYRQICESSGLEIGAVKSFIQNGRRNLKLILEKLPQFNGTR